MLSQLAWTCLLILSVNTEEDYGGIPAVDEKTQKIDSAIKKVIQAKLPAVTEDTHKHLFTAEAASYSHQDEKLARLKYALFTPKSSHRDANGLLPILVFLHGAGESGNFDVMESQSLPKLLKSNATFAAEFPFLTFMPQCPLECMFTQWSEENFKTVDRGLFYIMRRYGGDPKRVHLTGQSMGGWGAWAYAGSRPKVFASVVPICSYVNSDAQLIATELCCADGPKGGCCPAVWMFHAANDVVVPVEQSEEMNSTLFELNHAKGQVVKFTRYASGPAPPGQEFAAMFGHGSYELAFREPSLYNWMLEQQCEKCAPPTFELAHLAPSPPSPPPKTFMNLRGRNRGTRNHLPRKEVMDDMSDVPRQTNLDASERPLEDF